MSLSRNIPRTVVDPAQLTGITIISCGRYMENPKFVDILEKWLKELGPRRSWFVTTDLIKELPKDPAAVVGWGERGWSHRTQIAVIGQPGFFNVMVALIDSIRNGNTDQLLVCTKGDHRSDVSGHQT
jgi:hypothetical protein